MTTVIGSTQRRTALDGMRAVAILAVFASHAIPHAWGGWMGVELFFALSGYLITGLLLREWERNGRISLKLFYFRRILRLYPALIVILLLCVPFYSILGDGGTWAGYGRTAAAAGLYFQDFVWAFSGQHGGFGHSWSLAVEEQFYLVWPPVLYLALRRRRPGVRGNYADLVALLIGAAVICLLGVGLLGRSVADNPGVYFLPWGQAPLLLAGSALAAARAGFSRRTAAWLAPMSGVAFLGLAASASLLNRGEYLAPLLAAASVVACVLIVSVESDPTGPLARLLSVRPLAYLGRISYGFYLYYLVVIELVDHFVTVGSALQKVIELVVTLLCAMASYRFVETPFLRLKDRSRPMNGTVVVQRAEPASDVRPASVIGSERENVV